MSEAKHPGEIAFVDGATGQVVDRVKIGELPEALCFENDEKGRRVPVVKIVAHTEGDRRTLLAYGAEGQLLRSTTQYRD